MRIFRLRYLLFAIFVFVAYSMFKVTDDRDPRSAWQKSWDNAGTAGRTAATKASRDFQNTVTRPGDPPWPGR